jgi:Flp pilus assembly protein TadB
MTDTIDGTYMVVAVICIALLALVFAYADWQERIDRRRRDRKNEISRINLDRLSGYHQPPFDRAHADVVELPGLSGHSVKVPEAAA